MPSGDPTIHQASGALDQAQAEIRDLRQHIDVLNQTTWTKHPCTDALVKLATAERQRASDSLACPGITEAGERNAHAIWRANDMLLRAISSIEAQLAQPLSGTSS